MLFVAIDVHDYRSQITFCREVFGWKPAEEEVDGQHYAGFMDAGNGRSLAVAGELGRPGICDLVRGYSARDAQEWDQLVGAIVLHYDADVAVGRLSGGQGCRRSGGRRGKGLQR